MVERFPTSTQASRGNKKSKAAKARAHGKSTHHTHMCEHLKCNVHVKKCTFH